MINWSHFIPQVYFPCHQDSLFYPLQFVRIRRNYVFLLEFFLYFCLAFEVAHGFGLQKPFWLEHSLPWSRQNDRDSQQAASDRGKEWGPPLGLSSLTSASHPHPSGLIFRVRHHRQSILQAALSPVSVGTSYSNSFPCLDQWRGSKFEIWYWCEPQIEIILISLPVFSSGKAFLTPGRSSPLSLPSSSSTGLYCLTISSQQTVDDSSAEPSYSSL